METSTTQFMNGLLPGFLIVNQNNVLKEVMFDVRSVLVKSGLSPVPPKEDLVQLTDLIASTNLEHPVLLLEEADFVGEVRASSLGLSIFACELSLHIDHVIFSKKFGSLDWLKKTSDELRILVVDDPVDLGQLPASACPGARLSSRTRTRQ